MCELRDSYKIFLERFEITKEDLFNFGLQETIYPDCISIEKVRISWDRLKYSLLNNEKVYIRQYSQKGDLSILFQELIKLIFNNSKVQIDPNRNSQPTKIIEEITGFKKKKNIANYQVSHIFGKTKNPLLVTATWNIAFTPKIIDPFTGTESNGEWKNEYQKRLKEVIKSKFSEFIDEYNNLIGSKNIETIILNYVETLHKEKRFSVNTINKFKNEALKNFEIINI